MTRPGETNLLRRWTRLVVQTSAAKLLSINEDRETETPRHNSHIIDKIIIWRGKCSSSGTAARVKVLVNNLNIKLQVLVYSMVSSHQHEGKKIRCYNLKREKKTVCTCIISMSLTNITISHNSCQEIKILVRSKREKYEKKQRCQEQKRDNNFRDII